MNIGDYISIFCVGVMITYFAILIVGGILIAIFTEDTYSGWD